MQNFVNQNPNEVRTLSGLGIVNSRFERDSDLDRQAFNSTLAGTLTRAVHTILTHTSSERGRSAVPLITNVAGISPFPIRISVKVGGVEVGGV